MAQARKRNYAQAILAIRFIGRTSRQAADAFRNQEFAKEPESARLIARFDQTAELARRIARAMVSGTELALSPQERRPALQTLSMAVEILERTIRDVPALGREIFGEEAERPRPWGLRAVKN